MTVAASASPQADRKALWTSLRVLLGLALLGGLAYFLWTPGDWDNKLFVWVLLTLLADECSGWFGYAGVVLGGLVLLGPGATPEQWFVALPLIGAALVALLLLKHSGGAFVLPFAALLFAGVVLGADRVGSALETPIKLLGTPEFRRMALLPMAIGVTLSFVRQLIVALLRWRGQQRGQQKEQQVQGRRATPPAGAAPAAALTTTGAETEVIVADPPAPAATSTTPPTTISTTTVTTAIPTVPAPQTPKKPGRN